MRPGDIVKANRNYGCKGYTAITKDKEYKILKTKTCDCGRKFYDVGVRNPAFAVDGTICHCLSPLGGIKIWWVSERYLVPTESCVEIKLNDTYIAKVFKDTVVVGCTTISHSKIKELYKAIKKKKK